LKNGTDNIYLQQFQDELSGWEQVSIHPHRFGGKEFRLGNAEVGHLHSDGVLDIPFTRKIRDELLHEELAERHRWLPDSGWTTFRIRSAADVKHAVWLMRLSYLRYMLRKNPHSAVCTLERRDLHLSPELDSLLCGIRT